MTKIRAAALACACLAAMTAGARAQSSFGALVDGATPLIDVRARYEDVDDASKAHHGDAYTLRARLGVQTGAWHGLSALVEMDQLWDLNGDFNSTRNGRTTYAMVADPQMTALNRLQLQYASDFDTAVVVGRQRILLGDQRFVGNAGWRQHEQTFDAASLVNTSVPGLTATYAYVARVNRVYGPGEPEPATGPAGAFHCDCHLIDLVYAGIANLRLEGFGLLVDLAQHSGAAAAKLATEKLSTATFGADANYHWTLAPALQAQLNGEYAHQGNYRDNPLSLSLDYWRGEAGASYDDASLLVGYEAMQGTGSVGFSTPLATIHSFDGWADMFLTTPANGLDDVYVKAGYALPFAKAIGLDAINASLVYRDFSADRTGIGLGSEWDGALEFDLRGASLLLQYADYRGGGVGAGGFADKSIGWVQLAYKY